MGQKGFLQSQTIIGAIKLLVPIIFILLKAFGIEVPTGAEATFTENLINVIVAVAAIWGVIDVVIGRFKAKESINFGRAWIKKGQE